jgi:hypothetical protein
VNVSCNITIFAGLVLQANLPPILGVFGKKFDPRIFSSLKVAAL